MPVLYRVVGQSSIIWTTTPAPEEVESCRTSLMKPNEPSNVLDELRAKIFDPRHEPAGNPHTVLKPLIAYQSAQNASHGLPCRRLDDRSSAEARLRRTARNLASRRRRLPSVTCQQAQRPDPTYLVGRKVIEVAAYRLVWLESIGMSGGELIPRPAAEEIGQRDAAPRVGIENARAHDEHAGEGYRDAAPCLSFGTRRSANIQSVAQPNGSQSASQLLRRNKTRAEASTRAQKSA